MATNDTSSTGGADDPADYYSTERAAALLGVSGATVVRWGKTGRPRYVRASPRSPYRWYAEDVDRLVAELAGRTRRKPDPTA